MTGLRVVPVKCLENGYIDMAHLTELVSAHAAELSCIMITYPSTYGLFEENVRDVIALIHAKGGQVSPKQKEKYSKVLIICRCTWTGPT
jgi:glycine dehydrogenase